MKNIYYVSADEIYRDLVTKREYFATQLSQLVLDGEAAADKIKAAARYDILSEAVRKIEQLEDAKKAASGATLTTNTK
ncbi:hypothetical protein [Lacticaseibacillus mingshuiensis]|uniref:Uncharacterized protein n=1 Tax=Lacticaseibacillus mingshuiensis TaxID=2799574 RepID=A0ABW4CG19_9LACO|nr:hypothetical protein [Lacticaseibacillus mingshuiensis]